jgi:hypothetical protein
LAVVYAEADLLGFGFGLVASGLTLVPCGVVYWWVINSTSLSIAVHTIDTLLSRWVGFLSVMLALL